MSLVKSFSPSGDGSADERGGQRVHQRHRLH